MVVNLGENDGFFDVKGTPSGTIGPTYHCVEGRIEGTIYGCTGICPILRFSFCGGNTVCVAMQHTLYTNDDGRVAVLCVQLHRCEAKPRVFALRKPGGVGAR